MKPNHPLVKLYLSDTPLGQIVREKLTPILDDLHGELEPMIDNPKSLYPPDRSIKVLNLPVKHKNALIRGGIETLHQLLDIYYMDGGQGNFLLVYRNIGKDALKHIRNCVLEISSEI